MTRASYQLTREIALIFGGILSVYVFVQGYIERSIMNLILLTMFIIFSVRYEKRCAAITTGYLFVFLVFFITNTLASCYFTETTLKMFNNLSRYGVWTGDHYDIYFMVMFFVYLSIIIYTFFLKMDTDTNEKMIAISHQESISFEVGYCIMLIAYFIYTFYDSDRAFVFAIPLFPTTIINYFFGYHRIRNGIEIILLLIVFHGIFEHRYQLIQVIFPLLIIVLMVNKWRNSEISISRINIIFSLAVLLVLSYGVVSEVYKLNTFRYAHYTIERMINNWDIVQYFIMHQFYRVSLIWIKIGAYVIEHVQRNGYFYGLTFIKVLSPVLGFEYISIPKLLGMYGSWNYAPPGLLAEGYANFGIIGAVLNLLTAFGFMECLYHRFCHHKTAFYLIASTVPFTQIILDGGSINSAINLLILCIPFWIWCRLTKGRLL